MRLRQRDKSKELGGPSFKFRPNNFFEKVNERLLYKNPNNIFSKHECFAKNIINKNNGALARNLAPIHKDLS